MNPSLPSNVDPPFFSGPDLIAARRAATPDRTAVIDAETDRSWTYRKLDRRVEQVANALSSTDGPIGILSRPRPAFVAVLFAAVRSGRILVPLSTRETADALAEKAARASVSTVVCERETASRALEIAAGPVWTVDDPRVWTTDEPTDDRVSALPVDSEPDGAGSESDGAGSGPDGVKRHWSPMDPAETQLLLYTSGTDGRSKGVRLTLENLLASATASAFRLGVLPTDRWLCCLPVSHMGGIAPVIRSALYGTTLVTQRRFEARKTAAAMAAHNVTGISLVPTMCKRLLDSGWTPPASLRFVLLGGAPASEELLARCLETGVPVHPTYGTTEAASQIATATPAQVRAHPGTVGQPLVCTTVAVLDETGAPVPDGETGELAVSGPTVTPGYLDEDRTAAAFGPYGLHTGDRGYRDEDGRLWVLGRYDDRIITGGENVDPEAVAAALCEHAAIEAAAVVGLPDETWGERVAALLVPSATGFEELPPHAAGPDPGVVRSHCEARLAGFKRPKTIGYADSLPRTASGTVDRGAVRARLRRKGIDLEGWGGN